MTDWAREILTCGAFAAAFGLLFFTGEILRRVYRWNPEVTRKLIHLSGCLIAMLFPVFLHSSWSVLILCASFALLLLIAPRFRLLRAVNDVDRESAGGVSHPLAIYICYMFAARIDYMVFYEIAMLVLAFSDSSAALTGMLYGQKKYLVEGNSRKSIEGSVIFFLLTFLIVEIMLLLCTGLTRIDCILSALLIAVLVTLFEAISLHGTDNLFVPLGTIFILAKNTSPSTRELVFQFEVLAATFAAAAILAYPYRKITRTGLVAPGLGIYVAWGLVEFAWAIPMLAATFLVCRTGWVLPEPENTENACRVRSAFYFVLVPTLWLLAANLAGKLAGTEIYPLFYSGFLAAVAGQILLARQKNRTERKLKYPLPHLTADAFLLCAGLHATGFFVFGPAHTAEWAAAGMLAVPVVFLLALLQRPILRRDEEIPPQWRLRIRLMLVLTLTLLPNAVMFQLFGRKFL